MNVIGPAGGPPDVPGGNLTSGSASKPLADLTPADGVELRAQVKIPDDVHAALGSEAFTTRAGDVFTNRELLQIIRDHGTDFRGETALDYEAISRLFPHPRDPEQVYQALDRLSDQSIGLAYRGDESPHRITSAGLQVIEDQTATPLRIKLETAAANSTRHIVDTNQEFLTRPAFTTAAGDVFTNRELLQVVRDHGIDFHGETALDYEAINRLFPHPADSTAVYQALDRLSDESIGLAYRGDESPHRITSEGLKMIEDGDKATLAQRLSTVQQNTAGHVDALMGQTGATLSTGETFTNRQLLEMAHKLGTDPYDNGTHALTYQTLLDRVAGNHEDLRLMHQGYTGIERNSGFVRVFNDVGDSGNVYLENSGFKYLGLPVPEAPIVTRAAAQEKSGNWLVNGLKTLIRRA